MTKSTPKTTNSKKPAAKKTAKSKMPNTELVKKPVSAASKNLKTPVQKKRTQKKPDTTAKTIITKKTTSQTKKASLSKEIKPTLKKTAAVKTPIPKKPKDDLRKIIASLETRMKRADTLTRKSVKALETAVMTLDARTRKDNSTSKAALTRKVNQLSAKLTEMVEKTQAEVNTELKTALNNPTLENLQGALSRADQRLTSAEQTQALAISKVNRHLASIATAVDARIDEEAKARIAAIAALQAETKSGQTALTERLDTIEADTARALANTGDKIAELSEELTQRGKISEASIREKVSEIALQTQAEFETYRAGLDRRIDDITQNQPDNDTQRLEQSIAALTARLEGLEYVVTSAPQTGAASSEITEKAATPLNLVAAQPPVQQPQSNVATSQDPSYQPQVPDAFSPLSQLATEPAVVMPNPYLTAEVETEEVIQEEETTGPVEFDPRNYMESRQQAVQLPPPPIHQPTPAPLSVPQEPLRDFTQSDLMPNAAAPLEQAHDLNIDQALPYADPAYAETDPTMDRVRIGGEGASKFNLPKLTGRNLRVAALATGVAVIGLVAAKGVFGGSGTSPLPNQTAENIQNANNGISTTPPTIAKPDTSVAPIGDYADNRAIKVEQSSDAAKTLNSAASAGDPIAQFQLGLSYLEQGRTDEGVALIRKAANQNQPAAQYRLAKLYEIGEGVTQDSETARQLTERAARNGNRIAMHDLALYYAEGRGGVEADLPKAANWFEKAAERGVVDSQFNLAVLFESGQGLPKNIADAYVWYSIAAGQGDQFAKTRVEVLKETLDQADLVSALSRAEKFKPVKIDEAANGIFRNVAWAKSSKPSGEKVSQVRQVQTMLTELGYEIGGADGAIGPKTRAAIISFERTNSLPETGRVNASLIDRLELATGA